MESQVTNNENALRLFFTDDVFVVEDKSVKIELPAVAEAVLPIISISNIEQNAPGIVVENTIIPAQKPSNQSDSYAQKVEILPIVEEPLPQKTFKFLGGNKKSVLILVNDETYDVSSEQGRELLRKIVKAIDLSTPDFALLNYANYSGATFAELEQFFKPQIMLSFGVEATHLKLNLTWAGEIILYETTRIIFAPNLHPLDSDLSSKKSLWGNLQKIK
ncbi:hypothetical protein [Pedobacter jamesrossensis]|uniref:Uncharacterized protein n=1 Tax=Pedobacter jamesrossensis TaxID=1908238 RepID=A0ABV8NN73_9SPHI